MENIDLISKHQKAEFIYNCLSNIYQSGHSSAIFAQLNDDDLEEQYQHYKAMSIYYRKLLQEIVSDDPEFELLISNMSDSRINKLISTMSCIRIVRKREIKTYILAGLGILCVLTGVYTRIMPLIYLGFMIGLVFLFFKLKVRAQIRLILDDEDINKVFPEGKYWEKID